MRHALHIGCCLLSLALPACGGEILGVGSLVMQGLQMASGTNAAPSGAKNSAPFARANNAAEQRALDDVASRAVSQSCVATKDVPEQASIERRTVAAPRHCGYRDVCLAGHTRPVRMLICEKPDQSATAVLPATSLR